MISAKLVDQADASTLLTQVQQYATSTFLNATQCLGQLFSAVATQAAESIAREAL